MFLQKGVALRSKAGGFFYLVKNQIKIFRNYSLLFLRTIAVIPAKAGIHRLAARLR